MASDSDKKIIIRCLAIDDEPLALMQLKMMIERIPYLQLSGACSDAIEAREMMKIHEVDAIFIDIKHARAERP